MSTGAARPAQFQRPTPKGSGVTSLADASTRGPAGDVCECRLIDEEKVERARAAMLTDEEVGTLTETFRVLGDPTRLRIVRALMAEELCVCDLATLLGLSQPTVSHSLRALRQLRLVRYRKVGRIAYYAIDDEHVRQIVAVGLTHVGEATQ